MFACFGRRERKRERLAVEFVFALGDVYSFISRTDFRVKRRGNRAKPIRAWKRCLLSDQLPHAPRHVVETKQQSRGLKRIVSARRNRFRFYAFNKFYRFRKRLRILCAGFSRRFHSDIVSNRLRPRPETRKAARLAYYGVEKHAVQFIARTERVFRTTRPTTINVVADQLCLVRARTLVVHICFFLL